VKCSFNIEGQEWFLKRMDKTFKGWWISIRSCRKKKA